VPGSLTLDDPDMMAQASRAGIGLAYLGERLVADDIASGRLVEVLSEWTPSYPGYCLYYPGHRHMGASLRAFVDLAQEIVRRHTRLRCEHHTIAQRRHPAQRFAEQRLSLPKLGRECFAH